MRPVLVVLALLAGCRGEPESPTVPLADDPAAASLDQLRALSRAPVQLFARRGIPSAVYLQVPFGDGDPVDEAYTFLETFAPLYGLSDPRSQLHPRRADTDRYGTHVRFVQRSSPDQGGLPLFNSGLTLHVNGGTLYLTTGRYVPDLSAAPPVLGWQEAFDGLQTEPALAEKHLAGEARLGLYAVWPEDGGPAEVHTVWRFTVEGSRADTGAPVFWRVDVDATTGALVHLGELVATCDKDFDMMFGDHQSTISCWAFVATQDWFDAEGMLDEYSSSLDHDDEGLNLFDNAHITYDYYEDTFGQCSYDGDDAEVEGVSHAVVNPGNASAIGYCGTMQFSDGFTGLAVVAHEFTHLVDYNHNDLEYEGLSGALDESFADAFGAFIGGNWNLLGRSMEDPPGVLSPQPDHMLASVSGDGIGLWSISNPSALNDQGNVHTNSGIPNKVVFLVTDGGEHNGYSIGGFGQPQAEQLYHAVHTSGVESDSDFVDARNVFVGTALYWGVLGFEGFDTDDWCDVANAWASVGVATADADVDCDGAPDGSDGDNDDDGTADGADNCPVTPNPSQGDLDGDGLGNVCDPDQDNDGTPNEDDNCFGSNPEQEDEDGDGVGDACDDGDHDGTLDVDDNCPGEWNWDQADTDGDGTGDTCDPDLDGDGDANEVDNCPEESNANQADADLDGVGDVCDNCAAAANPDQQDCDNDGLGTACDELDAIFCLELDEVAVDIFVHPLDEVSLPHVAPEDVIRLTDDYRLQLTVVGMASPWAVLDHFGNVVAKGDPLETGGREDTVTWKPALDYHFVEPSGRAHFATEYRLALSPTAAESDVSLVLEGATAE
jgi:Thermolysin metallopeptidase, alpha-helical domain/Thrombospondin type 3 repeat/Thermolysin metallopeptidase, catalytic domain